MHEAKDQGFCVAYAVKDTPDKGLGLFATHPIAKGSMVWRHIAGQFTLYDEGLFRDTLSKMSRDKAVYELTHVFGLRDLPGLLIRVHDDAVLINHATQPNLITNNQTAMPKPLDPSAPDYLHHAADVLLGDRFAMIAARDIQTGEELTNDYNAEICDPQFYHDLCDAYGVDEDYL